MKTESTQINFLSDVLVAVASLDRKVPIILVTSALASGSRYQSIYELTAVTHP